MANYHPADELLMQFAAGQLTNALGIQTACHIEQCERCRSKIALYEQLGGDLVDDLVPAKVNEGVKDQLIQRLHTMKSFGVSPQGDEASALSADIQSQLNNADPRIPKPLRRFLPNHYEQLPWSGFSKSIQSYDLPIPDEKFTARFYKIAAGSELPQHTHKGNEYTLVLSGSFSDLSGDYHPGDFVLADTSTHHQPKAHDKEDCICFAVMDAPLKMTGFFGRLLNPFLT